MSYYFQNHPWVCTQIIHKIKRKFHIKDPGILSLCSSGSQAMGVAPCMSPNMYVARTHSSSFLSETRVVYSLQCVIVPRFLKSANVYEMESHVSNRRRRLKWMISIQIICPCVMIIYVLRTNRYIARGGKQDTIIWQSGLLKEVMPNISQHDKTGYTPPPRWPISSDVDFVTRNQSLNTNDVLYVPRPNTQSWSHLKIVCKIIC